MATVPFAAHNVWRRVGSLAALCLCRPNAPHRRVHDIQRGEAAIDGLGAIEIMCLDGSGYVLGQW